MMSGPYMRPYLRVANVLDGYIDYSDVLEMNFAPYEAQTFNLQPGDVLVNEGQALDLVGRCAIFDGPPGMCFQNTLLRFRSRTVLPKFAAAVFKHWLDHGEFRKITRQTTSIAHLGSAQFTAMRFPYAPMQEQQRVTEILDSADRLIGHQQSILLKRGLLATALTETFMREASMYPSHQLHSIVESAVDGPFGSNLKSEHYVEMPGTRVVRLQNIGTGKFLDNDRAYVENRHAAALASHDVRGGDLLAASLGDERHPIARACIYPIHLSPGIVKADCFRIRLKPLVATSYYVMQALNSSVLAPSIKAATQGVTRDRINLGSLLSVNLPVPPLGFQNDMQATIEAEVEVMHATEREIAKLRVEKRGLMDDLLTGRVRVTALYLGVGFAAERRYRRAG
jgi:type I restriction enzyme S subunit